MPGPAPEGLPAPDDGSLPAQVRDGAERRRLGVYVHVPFCRVRCGYCDFTTYTADELGPQAAASRRGYPGGVSAELDLAVRVLDGAGLPRRAVSTVFLGGGTPTLLPAADLAGVLGSVRDRFGLAAGAEVTTEANPDSVDAGYLAALAGAGFTRVSFGVQSAVPHVLATLDRTHDPARVPEVVAAARAAGLQVSVDLIYGTPGESLADWRRSLEAAVALEPDHVSAYALVVEQGTRLAVQVRRGELAAPDDDDLADKYELADELLGAAGLGWYEVSNWARTPAAACRHNLGYWRGDDWWGVGPGAHSHVGGVRWWNVRHPAAWAAAVEAGRSPAQGREVLGPDERAVEDVLLRSRLAEGLPLDRVPAGARDAVDGLAADGLLDDAAARAGRVVPTLRGRLLSDVVARALTG
ncbi:radical SAM family heme chaperone HemW [Aquipuribacter sp. SD81]|uniref:radical SAM family heme chaperone HemW n=1 Tax=Aquipuribacter sp. SD81 TaxID=3127703 RepID=UPI003017ECF2